VTKRLAEEEVLEEEPEPLLYDADAAAKILGGISKAMVYRYVQHGELHPVKLGSRTLFTMEELQRFVRDRQKAG
jgi:excisionase family DNA binding protein